MAKRIERRNITVRDVRYHYWVRCEPGVFGRYFSLTVRPIDRSGRELGGILDSLEISVQTRGGSLSVRDPIVVTPRVIRRVLEFAIDEAGYDPAEKGPPLHLPSLQTQIDLRDARSADDPWLALDLQDPVDAAESRERCRVHRIAESVFGRHADLLTPFELECDRLFRDLVHLAHVRAQFFPAAHLRRIESSLENEVTRAAFEALLGPSSVGLEDLDLESLVAVTRSWLAIRRSAVSRIEDRIDVSGADRA
ncbi:MAG: hypothetical protein AAF196_15585 [Planctomycetota bacterium]